MSQRTHTKSRPYPPLWWAIALGLFMLVAIMALQSCAGHTEGVITGSGKAVEPCVDYFEYNGMPCLYVFSCSTPHYGGGTCDWSKWQGVETVP